MPCEQNGQRGLQIEQMTLGLHQFRKVFKCVDSFRVAGQLLKESRLAKCIYQRLLVLDSASGDCPVEGPPGTGDVSEQTKHGGMEGERLT